MARRHDGPSVTAARRELKYRTSCDNCQAAKVKCGQGKPCRRCSLHMLQCVYSPSRRMGRPRSKKNGVISDSSSLRQTSPKPSGNNITGSTRSRPPTPEAPAPAGCTVLDTTAAVVGAEVEAAARPGSSHSERWDDGDSYQIPDELDHTWSPLIHGHEFEPAPNINSAVGTESHSRRKSVTEPMDVDGVSRCFELDLPSFLQTISGSTTSQPPSISAPAYENLFGSPLDLLLQIPQPLVADHEKDAPALPAEPSPSPRRTEQQQHPGLISDSHIFAQATAAASPRQCTARACTPIDQNLDDLLFDWVPDLSDGDRTFSRNTCLSRASPSTNLSGGRQQRAGAAPPSPPDTATASLRRLSTGYGRGSTSSLHGKKNARENEDKADHNDDENDESEDDEDEHDGEGLCIIPSSFSPPSNRPQSSLQSEPAPSSMSGARIRGSDHCGCVSAVSRCIVSLRAAEQQQQQQYHHHHNRHNHHQGRTSPPPLSLDSALLMESQVAASLALLDRCRACRCESTMQLLALVGVRMMLSLLQRSVRDEFTSPRRHSGRESAAGSDDSNGSNSGVLGEGRGEGMLWIGKYRVTPRARLRFLRRLLQARFYRLAVLVEGRERLMDDGLSRDCFSGASSLLLADISQGLQTVMGLLELWNSNS